jgi:probable HAF family extracellular repeat protein
VKRAAIVGLLFLGIGFGRAKAALADGFVFTTIQVPGASETFADGINNHGEIAGFFDDTSGPHGFVDKGGTFATIDPPSGPLVNSFTGIGINGHGQTVGEALIINSNGQDVGSVGFVNSGGVFTAINGPNGAAVHPFGINNRGQVVGFYSTSAGNFGFVDNHGIFSTVQDPNATGGASLPFAINNRGQIVGFFGQGSNTYGFLYSDGVYTTITDPAALGTWATGINDRGQIVGYFEDAAGFHGFVDSNGVFTTIDDPNASDNEGTFVYGINDSGQVVGTFGFQSFVATPVATPDPSTITLLVSGLVGLALVARRKLESAAMN